MKESTATTIITERNYEFTKAEVETILRREILGGDVPAKIVFTWNGDEINFSDPTDNIVIAVNTIVNTVVERP